MRAIDKRIEELAALIASEVVSDDYEKGYGEGRASAHAIIARLETELAHSKKVIRVHEEFATKIEEI